MPLPQVFNPVSQKKSLERINPDEDNVSIFDPGGLVVRVGLGSRRKSTSMQFQIQRTACCIMLSSSLP